MGLAAMCVIGVLSLLVGPVSQTIHPSFIVGIHAATSTS